MFTIQDKLNKDVRDYTKLVKTIAEINRKIDSEARELLNELRKIQGWECMIKSCNEHYEKYPEQFFDWCSVTHTENAVQFIKGYNNDNEYEVLEISLNKSLKNQVRERIVYLAEQSEKDKADERERDMKELQRIIKKYE